MRAFLGACVVLGAQCLAAQEPDPLPTERTQLVAPGSLLDLDTGVSLPPYARQVTQVDLRLDRDGAGHFIEPLRGGIEASPNDVEPVSDDWKPVRIRAARQGGTVTFFARTDRGVARVSWFVCDAFSTGSYVLRWVVVPPKNPVFLSPPSDLAAEWDGGSLVVTWKGEHSRWLVEVDSDGQVHKHTTEQPRIALAGLAPAGRHRIRVRGSTATDVGLPADVVQHGPRQAARRGTVEFPGRWYDQHGGLRLSLGDADVEQAEVVFYLYGVYVPGGGVRKVGTGEKAFRELVSLPDGEYPPVHGRLDSGDVLAVRIGDGRHARIWLEPSQGDDLREGMRAHFAFLPDGRRHLQTPPIRPTATSNGTAVEVRWEKPPGAGRFRLTIPGRPPIETPSDTARVEGLPPKKVLEIEIVGIATNGEESDPSRVTAHTYGAEARLGTAVLKARAGGFDFVGGRAAADGERCDLALIGGAGGAQMLRFRAEGGIAPAAGSEFGDFSSDRPEAAGKELSSDVRQAGSEHFFVHTVGGGRASVRIVTRGWPETTIEYLWLPGKK
jgi:hypothetical protein